MHLKSWTKKLLRSFYFTKLGQLFWRSFKKIVKVHSVKCIIDLALYDEKADNDFYQMPKIKPPKISQKNALVIMPFYGHDAASLCVYGICKALKEQNYIVHALHYNDSPWKPTTDVWDFTYYLKVQSGKFGKLIYDEHGNILNDSHKIDDWSGDELLQFISSLSGIIDFEICIVNYVFLSRALLSLPQNVYTLIYTHDVFKNRNSRLEAVGVSPEHFFFSVTEDEEKKGLERADKIIAIQSEEAEYFKSIIEPERVDVLPYIPEKRFFKFKVPRDVPIIGYLGSGHRPNVEALLKFVSIVDLSSGLKLHIAGTICNVLKKTNMDPRIKIVGQVDEVEKFYKKCDLLINPDTLASGFKVKCIEAMSFGKPLVCTENASKGIDVRSKYHLAKDVEHCAFLAAEAARNIDILRDLTNESKRVFNNFSEKFDAIKLFKHYSNAAKLKRGVQNG